MSATSGAVYLTVAALDVGSANFAVYVERVPVQEFAKWLLARRSSAEFCFAPGQAQWKVCWNLRSAILGERTDGPAGLTTPLPTPQGTAVFVPRAVRTQVP